MKIIVCFKVVPDDQDIQVAGDGSLDFTRAHSIVSTYDLNALEAAAGLAAAQEGSSVVAVTAGTTAADDSKMKKNVLSRGVDRLVMCVDDALASADARTTAAALASLIEQAGAYDLVLCGDGSADLFAKQVDVQLAARLGLPVVNGVVCIEPRDGSVVVERMLEDEIETVEVPLPAVISVAPDIALPRIPGMKDILAAGKKPMDIVSADCGVPASIEVLEERAPQSADRKCEVYDAGDEGAVEKVAAALRAAL